METQNWESKGRQMEWGLAKENPLYIILQRGSSESHHTADLALMFIQVRSSNIRSILINGGWMICPVLMLLSIFSRSISEQLIRSEALFLAEPGGHRDGICDYQDVVERTQGYMRWARTIDLLCLRKPSVIQQVPLTQALLGHRLAQIKIKKQGGSLLYKKRIGFKWECKVE